MKKLFIILSLIFCFTSQTLFGEKLNYPTRVIDGITYYLYTVQPKEGTFSIAKRFGITQDELLKHNLTAKQGLKVGQVLLVPQNVPTAPSAPSSVTPPVKPIAPVVNEAKPTIEQHKEVDEVKWPVWGENKKNTIKSKKNQTGFGYNVVVMLPFNLNSPQDKISPLYIEFYEGFLLAVDSLRRDGASFTIQTFDTEDSTPKVLELLNNTALKEADIIIAPSKEQHINLIAEFGKQNNINVINSFSLKNEESNTNPYLFQTNIPNAFLYQEAVSGFISYFKDHEVIFVTDTADQSSRKEFVDLLKKELRTNKKRYQHFVIMPEGSPQLDAAIEASALPVVVVPTSGSKQTLTSLMPDLRKLKEKDKEKKLDISLFGYPEWQTYTREFIENFYQLNTYMYSRFYTNPMDEHAKRFYSQYKYWYSKRLQPATPQYGLLGYDIGLFFLSALRQYGNSFDRQIQRLRSNSIQTDFTFERISDESGYINKSVYFVHFSPDYSISKIEVREYTK